MTAVASFYFATSALAASQPKAQPSEPTVSSVSPQSGRRNEQIDLQIIGTGLLSAQAVKLKQGSTEILASNVMSSDSMVKATLKLPADAPDGAYDVIVINSDGGTATLPASFTVQPN